MDPSLYLLPVVWSQRSMNFLKMQIIQDKSKPTRVAMIWLRLKVNRTRLCTAAHARPVLFWAHITFKPLLCRLRMKSVVTIASPTHVLRASSLGNGTLDQAQNGGFFNTGHLLSSWYFHRKKYTVGTRGFFSPAAGIFGVGRRPKSRAAKPKLRKESL